MPAATLASATRHIKNRLFYRTNAQRDLGGAAGFYPPLVKTGMLGPSRRASPSPGTQENEGSIRGQYQYSNVPSVIERLIY